MYRKFVVARMTSFELMKSNNGRCLVSSRFKTQGTINSVEELERMSTGSGLAERNEEVTFNVS